MIDLQSMKMCRKLPGYPQSTGYGCAGVVDGSILVCGSYDSDEPFCYTYNKDQNRWKFLTSLRSAAVYSGCAVINGALLLTGGHTGYYVTPKTKMVYPDGKINHGPKLLQPRYHHCAVNLLDGRFLVVGGSFQYSNSLPRRLLTSEFHDFRSGSAYYGPSLPSVRVDPACVLFHSPLHNNRSVVLVIGMSGQKLIVLDYTQPLATWETREY